MKDKSNISYEPEADVLTVELHNSAPIDSTREMGNVVVHLTERNVPVLIEILEASSFATQVGQLIQAGKTTRDTAAESPTH